MIIARLKGRLGNQMFAYATSYALSRKYNEELAIYKFEYDTARRKEGFSLSSLKLSCRRFYFGIPISLYFYTIKNILSIKLNMLFKLHLKEDERYYSKYIETIYEDNRKSYFFEPVVPDSKYKKHIIEGFRQSPLYFDEYYDEIVAQFQPNYRLDEESMKWQSEIENDDCSISIHIRRGDYVQIDWTVPIEYYYKSMEIMSEKYPDATFYVFSDDVSWFRKNFENNKYRIKYVEHHCENNPFNDIWLMSKCRHNIIANSSYSWWGAYLNCNKDKSVIAPQKIRITNNKDILPNSWMVV